MLLASPPHLHRKDMFFPPLSLKLRPDVIFFSEIFYMDFVERKILYKIHSTRFSYSTSVTSKNDLQWKKLRLKKAEFCSKLIFFLQRLHFLVAS